MAIWSVGMRSFLLLTKKVTMGRNLLSLSLTTAAAMIGSTSQVMKQRDLAENL